MLFAIILDTEGNRERGLYIFRALLEPFLNRTFSFAILHSSGNKDFFIDIRICLLMQHIKTVGGKMSSVTKMRMY